MSKTDTTETSLPGEWEKKLSELERRHKRHEAMLDEHHEKKHDRREDHRAGRHKMKFPLHGLK